MKKQLLFTVALMYISYSAFSQCVDPVITDFECSGPSHGAYPANLTAVANPENSGINTSANVGAYVDDGTNAWDALIFDYGATIDLTTNNILKIKLLSSTSIQILAKIEGGTGDAREIWSDFSGNVGTLGEWIEFTYDFGEWSNNSTGGDANTRLALFINGGQTGGTATDTYHIDDIQWASSTLSIETESINANAKIFPNPTQGVVNIDSKQPINAYQVIDVTGKVVIQKKAKSPLKTVDISSLKQGLYFMSIKSGNLQKTFKVLKQ